MCSGQGHDIYWRELSVCPTEEQYRQMVLDKTGGLFRLAVSLMQCFSSSAAGRETDFTPLLDLLGYYFQIRDDYLNVSSDAYMQTKSYCEDLTEGKFSFPIIHAIRAFPRDTRLLNIMRQRTENYELKRYAVTYMYMCGSMGYTRDTLRRLHAELLGEIERVGGHPELTALMRHLDAELDREPVTPPTPTAAGQGQGQGSSTPAPAPGSLAAAAPGGGEREAPNPVMSSSLQHSLAAAAYSIPYGARTSSSGAGMGSGARTISPKISTL